MDAEDACGILRETDIVDAIAMAAKSMNSPHPTAVYTRTGKGILAVKNRTAKLPAHLEDLFLCIDGKASVADLGAQSSMGAKELEQALDSLEEHGYIKVFRQGGDQSYSDFTEAPDLDFTTPGSLLEMSVREATKAKALADRRARDEAVQPSGEQASAEPQPGAHPEAPAQQEALDERIRDLERQLDTERAARETAEGETQALRRVRNDIVKAQAQAKASAAEEQRARADAEAALDAERRTREALQAELETERRARAEVEANAGAERECGEKATQALLEIERVIGSWKAD